MNRKIVITAAVLICTGIILGAFAAHGLKEKINDDGLIIFEKGVKYQMYHALALFAAVFDASLLLPQGEELRLAPGILSCDCRTK